MSQPGPEWHVKVADFGLTREVVSDEAAQKYTHQIGTYGYMAPEMWKNIPYSSAIDVWALGAITFCMRTGKPPFPDPTILGEYQRNPRAFPDHELWGSTEPCKRFIRKAMAPDARKRLTVAAVLDHDWLRG